MPIDYNAIFSTTPTGGGRRPPTLEELQATEAELRQVQQATGAREIEQEKPGFLARTVDVLSGFNYSLAGAYEELATGKSVGTALGRAARELYSSSRSLPFGQALPEVTAQKEAWGEVFKGLGYSTTTLADVFPAMEGTFLGELFNTRGTIGLAFDVLGDPLTYWSFGTSQIAKRTLGRFAKHGFKKGLNKKGLKVSNDLVRNIRKRSPDLSEEDMASLAAKRIIEMGDNSLFDPGGAKFAGMVIPGTPGLGIAAKELLSKKLVNGLNRFGLGRRVTRTSENYADALRGIYRETFGAFGPIENLKGSAQRTEAIKTARRWIESRAWLNAKYLQRVQGSDYIEYFRKNPGRTEAVMDMIDSGKSGFINAEETAAAAELSGFMREIAEDGVANGILHEEVLSKPSYIFHRYSNTADELPEAWGGFRGRTPTVAGKHQKGRVFDTMKEGERITGLLSKVTRFMRSKGEAVPLYPQLKPDYDIENGLSRYIDWYSTQKTVRGMAADFRDKFGFDEADFGDALRRSMSSTDDIITETDAGWAPIRLFFGKHKSLGKITEEAGDGLKNVRIDGWDKIAKESTKLLGKLDVPGKQQFFKEMFRRIDTPAQFVDVVKSFSDNYMEFFPRVAEDIMEGTVEDSLKVFGDLARYTRVGGNSIWGKGDSLVPRLIVDYVENADARIFNTKDFKGWRSMVRGVGRINNIFKTGVYPFFPSSAFRDKTSNLLNTAMRIGWHAINPELRGHSVAVLTKSNSGKKMLQGLIGDGFESKNGRFYKHDEVLEYAQDNNVLISGKQWAELTEDGVHRIVNNKPLVEIAKEGHLWNTLKETPSPFTKQGRARAMELRARLDNDDRMALFIQSLMDGLTKAEAAEDVAKFAFNYNELGPIHRDLVRNLIPFSTFTIKNIKLQAELLSTNPGKVINALKPFRGNESENNAMAKWDAEGLKLRLDGDGKTVRMVTGIDLPLRNLDTIWAGGFGATGRRMLGMLTPVIKAPIEFAADKDFFTNRSLKRATAPTFGRMIKHAPVPVQNWLGFKEEFDAAGRPKYTFDGSKYHLLVRSYMFSRLMSVSDRQFREYLDDGNIVEAMLDVATGLRRRDLDMNEQTRRKYQRRIRELEQSLVRRGEMREFSKAFTPRGQE